MFLLYKKDDSLIYTTSIDRLYLYPTHIADDPRSRKRTQFSSESFFAVHLKRDIVFRYLNKKFLYMFKTHFTVNGPFPNLILCLATADHQTI